LGIDKNHLVIGNGVAEFIKALPRVFKGRVVNVEPSFNEYAACFGERTIPFSVDESNNYDLDMDALIDVVHSEQPEAVVIITPNNPTGRLVSKEDLIKLYEETEALGTILIVDESFLDFSSQREEATFLGSLEEYPRILIFRSMSKTFGIGGLRLGYGATANLEVLGALRSEMPIWNINGFAEEFLLNLPQYNDEYLQSCDNVRRDTDELVEGLRTLGDLTVYDTESNFIMCKVHEKRFTANQIARRLLEKHAIYVKECSGKDMQDAAYFFRLSARTSAENKRLIEAMQDVFAELKSANGIPVLV
ncbi:MAG: histidinol-phosphate transaminase, partial [Tumebacillaceae bacterium]